MRLKWPERSSAFCDTMQVKFPAQIIINNKVRGHDCLQARLPCRHLSSSPSIGSLSQRSFNITKYIAAFTFTFGMLNFSVAHLLFKLGLKSGHLHMNSYYYPRLVSNWFHFIHFTVRNVQRNNRISFLPLYCSKFQSDPTWQYHTFLCGVFSAHYCSWSHDLCSPIRLLSRNKESLFLSIFASTYNGLDVIMRGWQHQS